MNAAVEGLGGCRSALAIARAFTSPQKKPSVERGRDEMGWRRCAVVAIMLYVPTTCVIAQVPPPPILPEQGGIAEKLVRAFLAKDEAGYAALLADDVQVFEDGQIVAKTKPIG